MLVQKSRWIGGDRRESWLTLGLRKVIPGYIEVVRSAPIALVDKIICYSAIAYRLVTPQTWTAIPWARAERDAIAMDARSR